MKKLIRKILLGFFAALLALAVLVVGVAQTNERYNKLLEANVLSYQLADAKIRLADAEKATERATQQKECEQLQADYNQKVAELPAEERELAGYGAALGNSSFGIVLTCIIAGAVFAAAVGLL